jgi:hypothetical protein
MNELSANDYEFSQTFSDGYFALDAPSSPEPNTSSNMCWNDDPSNPANAADARNGADIASDTFHSTYTVKPGDSPASISQHYFGTEKASAAILGTNGKSVSVAGARGLQVGEVLTLPSANEIDNSALLQLGGALIGADTRVRESQAAQQEAAKAEAKSKATALDQSFSLSATNTLPGSFIAGVLSTPATAPTPDLRPKEPYAVPLLTRILGGSAANALRTDLSGSEKVAIRDLNLASTTLIAGTGTVAALAPMALAGTAAAGEAALGLYWRNPVLYSTLGSLAGEAGFGFASGAPSPSSLTVMPAYVGGAAFGGGTSNLSSFAARAGDVFGWGRYTIGFAPYEPGTLSANPFNILKINYVEQAEEAAERLLKNARAQEPGITAAVVKVVEGNGGKLVGLDNKFKELDSLTGKIVRLGNTPNRIGDALRYTAIFDEALFTTGAANTIADLRNTEFVLKRVRNTFTGGARYVGVNVSLRSENMLYELQIHTPASFAEKNSPYAHGLYKEFRTSNNPSVRAALEAEIMARSNEIPRPPGIENILDYGARPKN